MKKTISPIIALLVICAMMTAAFPAFAEKSVKEEEIRDLPDFEDSIEWIDEDSIILLCDCQTHGAIDFYFNRDGFVIDGCGHTVYGNGDSVLLMCDNNSLVKNLNFVNCFNDREGGGAIYFRSNGKIENCSFTNCASNRDGGAVYFELNGSVVGCEFVDCFSDPDHGNCGGALYFRGDGLIEDSRFVNCNAYREGGAVCFDSRGEVKRSAFLSCYAEHGGAVFIRDGGAIQNCDFVNNRSDDTYMIDYFYPCNDDDLIEENNTFRTDNILNEELGTDLEINVILKCYVSKGGFYVKFMTDDERPIKEPFPDYKASLITRFKEGGFTYRTIFIHKNEFSCIYDEGASYEIYSYETGELLSFYEGSGNGAAPAPSDNSDDPAFPAWIIVLIASAVVVICGTAAFIIVKKKKKTAE